MRDASRVRGRASRFSSGAVVAVALLLAAGAPAPEAPIADAAMRGDLAAVRSLIKAGAEADAARGDGRTALDRAAELGQLDLLGALISAGANLNSRTRLGRHAPLHVAATNGHGAAVLALVRAGADPHAASVGGSTPLHAAA